LEFDLYSPYAVIGFTVLVVLVAIEAGILLGRLNPRKDEEKEVQTSTIVGSMLGLVAFMLAFTFGLVADRYDDRKAMVREEANAIGTAYLRSAFLPEAERARAARLFHDYLDISLAAVEQRQLSQIRQKVRAGAGIQDELWLMALAEVRSDMNSDVAALYIEALNAMFDIRSSRVAVALEGRIPWGIWLALYALMLLGMSGIGYQTAVTRSRRSWEIPLLALSLALVVGLISALDHPDSQFIPVSQGPLLSLKASMPPVPAGMR
jgi:hypothetical protein